MGITPDFMARAAGTEKGWWETRTHQSEEVGDNADMSIWAKAAGFDFTVSALDSGFYNPTEKNQETGKPGVWHAVAGRKTIVRSDTNSPLGWFTDNYKIHQPAEIRAFFENFILADDRFKMETMGSMKGGALIWALAKFRDSATIVGDKHDQYCLLATSYNGMWATTASCTSIRAVCQNTIEATIYGGKPTFRQAHNAPFNSVKQAMAATALANIAKGFDEYRAFAESLAGVTLARDVADKMLASLFIKGEQNLDDVSARKVNMALTLIKSLDTTLRETNRPLLSNVTAWDCMNAVTRYVDHNSNGRKLSGTSAADARLYNSMLGSGMVMKKEAAKLFALAA